MVFPIIFVKSSIYKILCHFTLHFSSELAALIHSRIIIFKESDVHFERKFKLSSQTVGLLRAKSRFPEEDKSSEVLLLENLSNYYIKF